MPVVIVVEGAKALHDDNIAAASNSSNVVIVVDKNLVDDDLLKIIGSSLCVVDCNLSTTTDGTL